MRGKLNKTEHGRIILYEACGATTEGKILLELPTLQCVHCGGHWVCKPGSGNVRGRCWRCNGPICGPGCSKTCIPTEQLLENYEKGRALDASPIIVPTSW